MENLIKLMEEYNLTLRRLPNQTTTFYELRHFRGLPNEEICETAIKYIPYEEFCKGRENGWLNNRRWNNGILIVKWVKNTRPCDGGWLVKIDNTTNGIQNWSKKTDFFGKTPEEAINKAVEHIKKKEKEREELTRLAGL